MTDQRISPINGKNVSVTVGGLGYSTEYKHDQDGFADLVAAEALAMELEFGKPYQRGYGTIKYTLKETQDALCLIRSELWRVKLKNSKRILVTTAQTFDQVLNLAEQKGMTGEFLIKSFEQYILESRSLTFVDKALQTLQNLYDEWVSVGNGKPFTLPCCFLDATEFRFRPSLGHEPDENGKAYGCDRMTAPFVYQFLYDEGYVKAFKTSGSVQGVTISAKGFAELDSMAKGRSQPRQGFLVRRYDEALDEFLRPVMAEVAQQLNCPIQAVWEQDHNDRIDERIFRLIRESSVVVVDMSTDVGFSPDRVNVGLELGYALALNKPVVVIRQKPADNAEAWKKTLPFDIITANCYDYERDDAGKLALVSKLVARVGLALDIQGQS